MSRRLQSILILLVTWLSAVVVTSQSNLGGWAPMGEAHAKRLPAWRRALKQLFDPSYKQRVAHVQSNRRTGRRREGSARKAIDGALPSGGYEVITERFLLDTSGHRATDGGLFRKGRARRPDIFVARGKQVRLIIEWTGPKALDSTQKRNQLETENRIFQRNGGSFLRRLFRPLASGLRINPEHGDGLLRIDTHGRGQPHRLVMASAGNGKVIVAARDGRWIPPEKRRPVSLKRLLRELL